MKSVVEIRTGFAAPLSNITSHHLGWKGFSILGFQGNAGEYPERIETRHTLGLWYGRPALGEHDNGRGGYIPYTRYPGTITFIPPQVFRIVRARNDFEVVLCHLEPGFVKGIEEELDRRPIEKFYFRRNVKEPVVRQLMTLLAFEASQGGQLGRLYADHLAHALVLRFLFLQTTFKKPRQVASALPHHLLQRVVERMHDLNADLDLKTLAAETGYSRTHFLRMFHTATGCTPHNYLLQLRVERARELMKHKDSSLIDIAALCGFSSHAHMSRMFRQFLGLSPGEFRRNL